MGTRKAETQREKVGLLLFTYDIKILQFNVFIYQLLAKAQLVKYINGQVRDKAIFINLPAKKFQD